MGNKDGKSSLAYIIEWLICDTLNAFDLIVRDTTSINDDVLLRSEVVTALWERALFKLATFTDYIGCIENVHWRDRCRAVNIFNLESNTTIPDCGIKKILVIGMLRKIRDEISHGARGNGIQPLRNVIVDNGIAYVQCRQLFEDETCNYDCIFKFKCNQEQKNCIGVSCKIAITDVQKAIIEALKEWTPKYKVKLENAVNKRRESTKLPPDEKPNDSIPWWFEDRDELFAHKL